MGQPYEGPRAVSTEFPPGTLWLDIEQHFHIGVEPWVLEAFFKALDFDRVEERRYLYDVDAALDLGERRLTFGASAAFTPAESPRHAPIAWAAGKAAWSMLAPSMELLEANLWGPEQILDVTTEVRISGTSRLIVTMHHPVEEIRTALYRE